MTGAVPMPVRISGWIRVRMQDWRVQPQRRRDGAHVGKTAVNGSVGTLLIYVGKQW